MSLFTSQQWASVSRAVQEEIKEARKGSQTLWLDIDAIEIVSQMAGHYVYRLLLSQPTRLQPEQTITFTSRGKERVQATVLAATDNELVVECESPLPDDARLQHVECNPAFIYEALLTFLEEKDAESGDSSIAQTLISQKLPPGKPVPPSDSYDGLNGDQCRAIAQMKVDPLAILWGPPGTGKTTTLGVAIAKWMREGKSVLLVSTSNAAVDIATKSLLKRLSPHERKQVLRVGTSTDKEIAALTLGGKFAEKNLGKSASVVRAQDRMRQISEIIATKLNRPDELQKLFNERKTLEPVVAQFNVEVATSADSLALGAKVFACTLAKMVLDKQIKRRAFDVVVVDEASMVSILYALAAGTLAAGHLIFAGDPKQLPPIVQSEHTDAEHWFGKNVFMWFGINESLLDAGLPMTLLRTQYRMCDRIGDIVSRLSYGGRLIHGRQKPGVKVMLVDVPPPWQTRLWSVGERSYYQPVTVPILHALLEVLGGEKKEMLLLTPFRAQQALLSAMAFDLKTKHPVWDIRSSTIHRSQGSERHTVVVDLTAHSPTELASFFEEPTGDLLFNVAISRAADRLVIIGSSEMLRKLAMGHKFWNRVEQVVQVECDLYSADEILEDTLQINSLSELLDLPVSKGLPAICCCRESKPTSEEVSVLERVTSSRKLLVAKQTEGMDGRFIMRSPTASCMPMFVAHGYVALPYNGGWLVAHSPAVSRVLWRIAFSHLADDEINPNEARRFFCPRCVPGNLTLKKTAEGWKLVCSEFPQRCQYSRHLSLEDARAKVRLQGMTCPDGHPLTARTSAKGIFLGCENYPRCEYTSTLAILAGA